MTNLLALQAGTELVSDYRIERVLGAGGFGITYLAEEIALSRRVTIKEYFPADYAARAGGASAEPRSEGCAGDYQWGLDRFIEEAQTLAKFDHPNIVRVYRYFQANNTAYMVLHFEEGQSLKSWLKGLGRAPRQREIDGIIAPLLDALDIVHRADFLHRDIAPDNIIIRADGSPVLIDFGAARGEIAAHSKTVSALVKPGYSPYEQYAETSRQQGPWTDIYALGATLYYAVTGRRPPDAPSRMVQDEYVPARDAALSAYRRGFLAAIDKALALTVDARPQSVGEWRGQLLAPDPPRQGLFGRTIEKGRERAKTGAQPPPAQTDALSAAIPPPPDAPGRQGGMLDFIDGLARPAGRDPADKAALADIATRPLEQTAPAGNDGDNGAGSHTDGVRPDNGQAGRGGAGGDGGEADQAAARLPVAKPARLPIRRPRPRRVRSGRSWPSLRPLLVKLLIGAGIAASVVALRDQAPEVVTRSTSVVASQRTPAQIPVQSPAQVAKRRPVVEEPSHRTLTGHTGAVSAVAFADAGRTIVSSGQDATIRVWSRQGGTTIRTIELDNGPASAFAATGRRALTGHEDGVVAVWDLDRGSKLSVLQRNEASIWSLAFIDTGTRFAAGAHDWSLVVWDTGAPVSPILAFDGHKSAIQAVAASPVAPLVASGSADKTVKLWDLSDSKLVRTFRGHKDFVTAITFRPDGNMMASGALDGQIRLWRTRSSRRYRLLGSHKAKVTGVAFSPSGKLLASAGEDGALKIWDIGKRRVLRTYSGHVGAVNGLAFSPDGSEVVTAGKDGSVRLWQLAPVHVAMSAAR